jgi:hypothetical protein
LRYHDLTCGKLVRATYKAGRAVVAERYAQWVIVGSPEMRAGNGVAFRPREKGLSSSG